MSILTRILIAVLFLVSFGVGAQAQQASAPYPSPNNKVCGSEHQAVVAACKADPCSQACKDAHKQMKQCRIANNLPMPQHKNTGAPHMSPCAKTMPNQSQAPAPEPVAPTAPAP